MTQDTLVKVIRSRMASSDLLSWLEEIRDDIRFSNESDYDIEGDLEDFASEVTRLNDFLEGLAPSTTYPSTDSVQS